MDGSNLPWQPPAFSDPIDGFQLGGQADIFEILETNEIFSIWIPIVIPLWDPLYVNICSEMAKVQLRFNVVVAG